MVVGWKVAGDKALPVYRSKGGFPTKRDALAYCPELLKAPKAQKRLTVAQVYDGWMSEHESRVSKSTMDCYRAAWKYFQPIHHMVFADVALDDLQECVDDCPHGKRTKENMKALAGLLMRYALPRHQTDMNYAAFIHTGHDPKGTRPAFDHQQVELIRQAVGRVAGADVVLILIYTGMRPAELLGLRKEDYRDGVLYGGIKTAAGKDRAVPVSSLIRPLLDARMAAPGDYLFPGPDGQPMSPAYFREKVFYAVLDAVGVQPMPTPDRPARYVPYSCRHTFANLLKAAPGADKDKAALIGHADYATTKKHYQSAELERLKSIIDALG